MMQKRTRLYLNKYLIFIVVLTLTVYLINHITERIYKPQGPFNYNQLMLARIFQYAWLISNLIMAIVIYGDMIRLKKLNWWIIGVTLINKEFGVIICLLHYFVNDGPVGQNNNKESILDDIDKQI